MAVLYRLVVVVFFLLSTTDAAKILAIFPFPAKSHVGAYQPLMEELAERGHEVTVITAFPRAKPLANYTEIVYEDTLPPRDSSEMNFFKKTETSIFFMLFFMFKVITEGCENFLKQPPIQELIHNTKLEYDLIMYEPSCGDCTYGLLHKFKAPTIQIFPNTIASIMIDTMGNPSTISYVPDPMSESDNLDFKGRFSSLLRAWFGRYVLMEYFYQNRMDSIMRKYFPDPSIPSSAELARNASFLFLHSHPVLHYPRPLTPNTIEVGGLHIKENQKLPTDLQKYLDEAPHGVIYFSLGSNLRSVDMPEEIRNAILRSFSKLKQRVLWKWEADNLSGQPKNVRLGKWLPQHAILAHPNVKLFITHGGLMSLEEATYFGVPLVAIPVMGDQKYNALHAQNIGLGMILEVHNITEESLDWAIHEALHEPRYQETAKRLSRIMQDQPQKPLDRAVFWVEYTLRHKGAPHMRSAALKLNSFQYYLLDVIAVLALIVLTSVLITMFVLRALLRRLFSKSTAISKNKKKN